MYVHKSGIVLLDLFNAVGDFLGLGILSGRSNGLFLEGKKKT